MPLTSSTSYRGGQSDRRRRLLAEELAHPVPWSDEQSASDDAASSWKTRHYGNAAFLEKSLRIHELIPRRMFSLILMFLFGAILLAGIEVAYDWMFCHVAHGGAAVTALDLTAKGSLGCWFCTATLSMAAIVALIVYSIRRHRIDDYQGRYRIWLWAAGCGFLMAADQAASLHEAFQQLMVGLTGARLVDDGAIWWASISAFLVGAMGSRLIMDMRPDKTGIVALTLAGVAWGVASTMLLGWLRLESDLLTAMVRGGSAMTASLFLLFAIGVHARYVVLDAYGLLPAKKAKGRRTASQDAGDFDAGDSDEDAEDGEIADQADTSRRSNSGDAWVKVDAPHISPRPVLRRENASATANPSPASSAGGVAPVQRKLTKDERRALKAKLLRERADRQRT
jgi:hypothetical protein